MLLAPLILQELLVEGGIEIHTAIVKITFGPPARLGDDFHREGVEACRSAPSRSTVMNARSVPSKQSMRSRQPRVTSVGEMGRARMASASDDSVQSLIGGQLFERAEEPGRLLHERQLDRRPLDHRRAVRKRHLRLARFFGHVFLLGPPSSHPAVRASAYNTGKAMAEGATREPVVIDRGPQARTRVAILLGLGALAVVAMTMVPRIAQDPSYHRFADTRAFAGIPNFWNVVSNASFVVVGTIGLVWLERHGRPRAAGPVTAAWETLAIAALFGGTLLTGLGSAYYHLAPDNGRLVWDRLPMTLTFMSLFALVIGDRIDQRAGRLALLPLLLVGIASVLSWHVSEMTGRGDLRLYAIVQFFPLLAVPLMLLLFPARFAGSAWLWVAVVLYAVAKVPELADAWVFSRAGVSGHTVKHVLAALATACLLGMFAARRPR